MTLSQLESLAIDLHKKYKISEAAERQNTKQLEKRRSQAVEKYNAYKGQLEQVQSQQDLLSKQEAALKSQLKSVYDELALVNQVLQNMALSGSKEVKMRNGEDTAYIRDGKEMRVEFDEEGRIKMSPYRQRKKKDSQDAQTSMPGQIPNSDLTDNFSEPDQEGMEVSPEYLNHL